MDDFSFMIVVKFEEFHPHEGMLRYSIWGQVERGSSAPTTRSTLRLQPQPAL
jgi:hypothetical protein